MGALGVVECAKDAIEKPPDCMLGDRVNVVPVVGRFQTLG